MKLLLLSLALIGCITKDEKETREVTYSATSGNIDVEFCEENWRVNKKFNTLNFDTVVYIPVGDPACITAEKVKDYNNIQPRVYIYVDGELKASGVGERTANARITVE